MNGFGGCRIAWCLAALGLACSSRPPVTEDSGTPPRCTAAQTLCGSTCADVKTDSAHCGACGTACASGERCAGGACYPASCGGLSCPATHVCIGDQCVERACFGVLCPPGQRCGGGACHPSDCSTRTCAPAEVCIMDTCVLAACVGVICPPGTLCDNGACVANTCGNGTKDGDETGSDCGGVCPPCVDGQPCQSGADCRSSVCSAMTCRAPTCSDGVRNGSEGDTDCGGACARCSDGLRCTVASQCQSGVCTMARCAAPACDDRIENGQETDLDCGGPSCPKCGDGKSCSTPADCTSMQCSAMTCVSSQCVNAMRDGLETDVDCGGNCAPCGNTRMCSVAGDCLSRVCVAGTCRAPTCSDAVRNGMETAVDCGGSCPSCGADAGCLVPTDCTSRVCTGTICQPPSCADGVRNGGESDADCGGSSSCPRCGFNAGCAAGADCLSGTCTAMRCTQPPLFAMPVFYATQSGSRAAGVADVDRDGRLDFAVANQISSSVTLYYGDGDGGFSMPYHVGIAQTGFDGPQAVALHDLTGDTRVDVITAQMTFRSGFVSDDGCRFVVLPGTATRGVFGVPLLSHAIDAGAYSGCGTTIAVARIDGDMLPDVLISDRSMSGFINGAGDKKGGFLVRGGSGPGYPMEHVREVAGWFSLADLNADGTLDVVTHSDRAAALRVAYGRGDGTFDAGFSIAVSAERGYTATGHFNADNVPELLVATASTSTFNIHYGDGMGGWSSPYTGQSGAVPSIVVADFDGDGRHDVVAGQRSVGYAGINFFRGRGDGTLEPARLFLSPNCYPDNLATGDFNADGKFDVLASCESIDGAWLFLNQRP